MSITPEQFTAIYTKFETWVHQLLHDNAAQARSVASIGFSRLPEYFSTNILTTAHYVACASPLPTPPLAAWGLPQFAEFEQMEPDGITYLDTYFVRSLCAQSERLHFHELIHVVQWSLLGSRKFAALYIAGIEAHGYRQSPLEVMAYDAEERFATNPLPFNAERHVSSELKRIYG